MIPGLKNITMTADRLGWWLITKKYKKFYAGILTIWPRSPAKIEGAKI